MRLVRTSLAPEVHHGVTHEAREFREVLHRVALRLAAGTAVRMLVRAAGVASTSLLLWALATLILPLPFPLYALAAIAALVLAVAHPLLVWRLRPPMLGAAQVVDRRLGLADRLGTAVDLLGRPGPITGLARLQVLDAIEAARAVVPRAVVPIRVPAEAWVAVAGCGLLVLWAQFLLGWSLPGTPAARAVAVIHHEGRALEEVGRRLDAVSRARGLPETRRAAPVIEELGRRLEAPRIARQDAAALLQETGRRLAAAEDMVQRRLLAAFSKGGDGERDTRAPAPSDSGARRLQALEEAVRQIRAVTGQLRGGGTPVNRAELSRRLQVLSDSLDQMGAPPTVRRNIAAARREADGDLSRAAGALGDAMQELQGIERMLRDEQALGEARRDVLKSQEKIGESGSLGTSTQVATQGSSEAAPPRAPGSNPVSPGPDEGTPPPPGPNQGNLPGQGAGGARGSPTPRLGGTRVPAHLAGIPGEGTSALKEITAPGQVGSSRLPATRPPAEVPHEIDRALSREPLPPAYRTIIRRYFERLGGSP